MHEVLIAGFGGQGVLATGVMLANAGLRADLNTTWLPSYGGTMRGGTANCSVKISDDEVASPYIDNPDVLIVFNEPSLDKFEAQVKPGGYIFINSSLVKREDVRDDVTVIRAPVTELATELGNVRAANVVMLGVLLSKVPIVSVEAALTSLEEYFEPKGEKVINLNRQALKKGMEVGNTQGESK